MKFLSPAKQWYVLVLLLLAYYAVAFYPILESGFYSDDIFLAQGTSGDLAYNDISVFQLAKQETSDWMKNGRFAPLAYFMQRAFYHGFSDAPSHKAIIYALNLLAVFSFAAFLYLLRCSKRLILLVLLLLPALVQFRVMHHDAYTTFYGLLQTTCILNFSALSMFVLYLRKGSWYWLAGALALLAMGLCLVEITLVFIPLYLIVAIWGNEKTKVTLGYLSKKLAPIAVMAALYFSLVIYLRVSMPPDHYQYEGLRSSFNADKMLKVVHAQVFSAIPLMYINYEKNFMSGDPATMFSSMAHHAPALGIIALLVLYFALGKQYNGLSPNGHPHTNKLFIWLGLLLLLLPALLMMPSVKYQKLARPGNGYILVYIQNMGAAMLFALLVHVLLGSGHRFVKYTGIALLGLFLLIVPIVFGNNMRLVAQQNERVYYPSLALEKALEAGLFDSVKERDVIWLTNNYHWGGVDNYEYLFFEKTNKLLQVTNYVAPHELNPKGPSLFQLSFPEGSPNRVTLRKVIGFEGEEPVFDEAAEREWVYQLGDGQ